MFTQESQGTRDL